MRTLLLLAGVSALSGANLVTYADVRPVMERRCVGCHQKGEIGPMALTNYAEARPWAKAIKQSVLKRSMPPWHADVETSARIHNSRLLSEEEVRQLVAWVDGGAAEGRPVRAVSRPAAETGWRMGKPDLVIRIPGYQVPEQGTLQYTFLVTPTGLTEDKWIAAAEWKIDQRAVVHHINAFIRPQGSSYVKTAPPGQLYVASKDERGARREDEREVDRRELLLGYEPGYRPVAWGPVQGKLLRKGSDIVFEMHYTANGRAVKDYSELGIYFAKSTPAQRVFTITPADSKLAIPPGDANYRSFVYAELQAPARLISMQPHMHLRGKAYRIDAVYPDGRRELLLNVPRYDFNWQTTYFLKSPMELPKGTKLECTAWFDNSPNNAANPDPAKTIYWGDQSWEEMNVGFMEIAFDARADADIVKLSDTTKPSPVSAAVPMRR
jgi:hypothetical protein